MHLLNRKHFFCLLSFLGLTVSDLSAQEYIERLTDEKPITEELQVIQAISRDKKSFVIAKGAKDGVVYGQEMIYANDNVSIVSRVKEISRDFSLWEPVDKDANVPFRKDEIVNVNAAVYGNVALNITGAPYLINDISVAKRYELFRVKNNISLKIGLNRGLSQSSAYVSEDKNSTRMGQVIEAAYHYRFLPRFEMQAGIRYDNETYTIENPELDIPTRRTIALIGATYHFTNPTEKNNYYITVLAGLGKMQTDISGVKATGSVNILPEVRFGKIIPMSRRWAFFMEGSIEAIAATEEFNDGTKQTTNITNMRASVGIRF